MREAVKAERLEAVLSGATSRDDVSRELARLATLAHRVGETVDVPPVSDEFRASLRTHLLTAPGPRQLAEVDATARGPVPRRPRSLGRRVRTSARTAAAATVAATLIGTTGVAAAAQEALPGEILYAVKGVTEDARLLFARDATERGRLHLFFARERLGEVERGVGRIGPDPLRETFTALDDQATVGANLLLQAAPTPQTREELTAFTGEIRSRLQQVRARLPLSVRPSAERTLEVLRRIDVQVTQLTDVTGCESCDATVAGDDVLPAPRVVLPGDGPAVVPCGCVAPSAPTTGTAPEPSDTPTGTREAPSSGAAPLDDPVDEPDRGSLEETLRDTTEEVGSVVDDLLDRGVRTPVGTTVDDLGSTVDDLESTVEDTVDDLESAVDDLGSEVGGTLDDLLGG